MNIFVFQISDKKPVHLEVFLVMSPLDSCQFYLWSNEYHRLIRMCHYILNRHQYCFLLFIYNFISFVDRYHIGEDDLNNIMSIFLFECCKFYSLRLGWNVHMHRCCLGKIQNRRPNTLHLDRIVKGRSNTAVTLR